MLKRIILILLMMSIVMSQSGFDILSTPTDSRDAALGLNLNQTAKPTRILTHPQAVATLSVWNWVADVQGAYIGVALPNMHLSFQAMNSGEIEYRNDIPSEEPISTFQYNLFSTGGAYARQVGSLILGLGAELVYERTLNASAAGLSLNLATAYELNQNFLLSGGFRHLGVMGDLDEESTELPSEIWMAVDATFSDLSVLAEINNGPIPNALGISYSILNNFELMGGLQVEASEPDMRVLPSAGFSAAWSSFTLGYSIYHINHNLGPRHFISLFWSY